jgi:hypothetical protein
MTRTVTSGAAPVLVFALGASATRLTHDGSILRALD